jgi:hypothetical protein
MYRAEKVQQVGRAGMTRLSYLRINNSRQLGDVRRYPPRLIARVKLAPANNTLAEISKAIERRCSHIAGKWLLSSSTAAHELVCKCKAGLLPITPQMARFTNP